MEQECFKGKEQRFKIARNVAFGIFPSTDIEMWQDLDTDAYDFSSCAVTDELIVGAVDEQNPLQPFEEDYEVNIFFDYDNILPLCAPYEPATTST